MLQRPSTKQYWENSDWSLYKKRAMLTTMQRHREKYFLTTQTQPRKRITATNFHEYVKQLENKQYHEDKPNLQQRLKQNRSLQNLFNINVVVKNGRSSYKQLPNLK